VPFWSVPFFPWRYPVGAMFPLALVRRIGKLLFFL